MVSDNKEIIAVKNTKVVSIDANDALSLNLFTRYRVGFLSK